MKSLALFVAAVAALTAAHAQYKVVGPDGRVTYTDRPEAAAGRAVALPSSPAPGADVALPLVLREPATRFPVTLYAAADCPPCDAGRQLLRERGIPYQERTAGPGDRDALVQAVGDLQLPALAIGRQVLRGFVPSRWHDYLDTAGYPRESKLPPNYAYAPAQPLVERAAPPPPAPPRAAEPPSPPPEPGGFRF